MFSGHVTFNSTRTCTWDNSHAVRPSVVVSSYEVRIRSWDKKSKEKEIVGINIIVHMHLPPVLFLVVAY